MATTIWRIHQARKAATSAASHGQATEVPNENDASKEGAYPQKLAGTLNGSSVSEVQ